VAAPADLRPRTVGEILDASFVLYRRSFGSLLLACTILSIPTLLVAVILARPAGDAFTGYVEAAFEYAKSSARDQGRVSRQTTEAVRRMLESSLDVQIWSSLSALLQSLSRGGACLVGAIAARAAITGEPLPGPWALVRQSLPALAAATALQLLVTLVTLATSLCCVLLPVAVVFGAALTPACAVVLLERPGEGRGVWGRTVAGVGAGVSRSLRLSWHGMTIVRGSTFVMIVLVLVSTVVGAASIAGYALSSSFAVPFALQHYAEVLFLPVIGGGFALWYYDLRVRREGADFEASA
jgi:hypothetical protein